MKTLFFFSSLLLILATASAQATYTNGAPSNMPPGNQAQPLDPNNSNGSTPLGQPSQNGSYSVTLPSSSGGYPSSTGTNPINPGAVSPTTPSPSTYPQSPGAPGPNKLVDLLYQSDPSRSPKNPKRSDPVATVDGSSGKYKSQHHTTPAKKNGFTTNRRTRGAKSHVSRERSSSRSSSN